jgi:hypothetical protein
MDILRAIAEGGWEAVHLEQHASGGQFRGVVLLVRDISKPDAVVIALQKLLQQIGLNAPASNFKNALGGGDMPAGTLATLFIAPKE